LIVLAGSIPLWKFDDADWMSFSAITAGIGALFALPAAMPWQWDMAGVLFSAGLIGWTAYRIARAWRPLMANGPAPKGWF
jgi:hypothetical protein